jgi:UDP-N-acetylmuramyl pentapeptide phosphotransferase/UDP-N-acetylglucosamine-1-phosphate transferase
VIFISNWVLSKKDFIQISLVAVFAGIYFGVVGSAITLLLQWFSLQQTGIDSASKHGISARSSSRLGGLSVMVSVLMFFSVAYYQDSSTFTADLAAYGNHRFGIFAIMCCAAMGLAEDLKADFLSPVTRLALKFFLFAGIIFVWPELVPESLGFVGIDYLLSLPFVSAVLVIIFLVGFINAVNMADGANGLVPGIAFFSILLFYMQTGRVVDESFMAACGVFLLFNVVTGRLFLGDAGTYGLGAALAIYGLVFFNAGAFSLAFLASLFAYPCIDFLVSIVRRMLVGRSPFSPDNDHLHNRIHFYLRPKFRSQVASNSLTGLLVSGSTSGLVLLGYINEWWPPSSNEWAYFFIFECFMYAFVFYLTGLRHRAIQHSAAI